MTKDNHGPVAGSTAAWDALTAWNGPIAQMFGQSGETYVKACVDWQQEVARFTAARLDQDRRLQESLVACRNVADAMKLQQDWAFAAIKDYFEETNRLASIASRAVQAGMSAAQQQARTETGPKLHAAE